MTEQLPEDRRPVLVPFLLGLAGGCAVLFVLWYGLVHMQTEAPTPSEYVSYMAIAFGGAFFWSGGIKLLFTQASHGVPAAGYASVYAVIGLVMILLTMDMGYLAFLFVSFIFLFLGRLGERAARWVFPERFR